MHCNKCTISNESPGRLYTASHYFYNVLFFLFWTRPHTNIEVIKKNFRCQVNGFLRAWRFQRTETALHWKGIYSISFFLPLTTRLMYQSVAKIQRFRTYQRAPLFFFSLYVWKCRQQSSNYSYKCLLRLFFKHDRKEKSLKKNNILQQLTTIIKIEFLLILPYVNT